MATSSVKVYRKESYQIQPWKNGMGSTLELASEFSDEKRAVLDWRISIATLTQNGLYSNFAGLDRCQMLLQGDSAQLDISRISGSDLNSLGLNSSDLNKAEKISLKQYSHCRFSGADNVYCTINPAVETKMFNLMGAADKYQYCIDVLAIDQHQQQNISSTGDILFLMPLTHPQQIFVDGKPYQLDVLDMLKIPSPAHIKVSLESPATDNLTNEKQKIIKVNLSLK